MSEFVPFFPEAVDSSMLAAFKSCPQLCKKIYIDQWKPQDGANVHLTAGGAFAKALEVARKAFFTGQHPKPFQEEIEVPGGGKKKVWKWREDWAGPAKDVSYAEAVGLEALVASYGDFQPPADSPKSLERMLGAFQFYMANYPLTHNSGYPILLPGDKRAIEVSFAHPLPILHPVTGLPILYVGRADMVCWYAGRNYVEDDKTTSRLGPTWAGQWDLRSQFMGYTWGFRQMGYDVAGCLVRGVSILKNKYETQEAMPCFSEEIVNRWYTDLLGWLEDMILCFKTGVWRYNFDHACAEYGGCGFKTVCMAEDEKPWLNQYFERRHWDPVTRIETKL